MPDRLEETASPFHFTPADAVCCCVVRCCLSVSELHASLQRLNSDVHAAIATAHWLSETITRHQRSDDLTPTTPTPQTAAAGDG